MPVLMNKGDDPRKAAWIFYSDRATLDTFGTTAYEQRFESGVLTVDAADLDAAKKASSEVPVWLEVTELVPEDYDLEQIEEALKEAEAAAQEAAERDAEGTGDGGQAVEGCGEGAEDAGNASVDGTPARADADETPANADGTEEAEADEAERPYDPVPAPEGLRVRVGTTTAAAARAFIAPAAEGGTDTWDAQLPGLQALVSLIRYMRDHNALPACAVWHIDAQGILRMAPAKQLKPMAGNVLKAKL